MVAYATREMLFDSLDLSGTPRLNRLIDNKLEAGSRSVDALTHKRFYPEKRTIKMDWPNYSDAAPWRLYLESNELISLTSITAGGNDISANVIPRRFDDIDEPPYSYLEIDLTSSAAFSAGNSFQRSIVIVGLTGEKDTDTSLAGALLNADINSSTNTVVLKPSSGYFTPGAGSLVLIGTERFILTDRRMADTGQNLQNALLAKKDAVTVTVTDGTAFAIDEILLIDSERMKVLDIAGNNLTVERGYAGTLLAAHTATTADIFALRSFVAKRAQLGSTAAAHTAGDSAYVHQFPALVSELAIAEAIVMLEQSGQAWASKAGNDDSIIADVGTGLPGLRCQVKDAYGRRARLGAI